jgi:hypothetical protein
MPRDGIFDGLLDGDDVLGGQFGIAVQPVPNVLLLDRFGHDDRQAARQFGLSAGCLYCPFDRAEFCHVADGTQPPLFSQQPPLLGNQQHGLYAQYMEEEPEVTYGQRLKKAMNRAGFKNDPALAKALTAALIADGVLEPNKTIPQQTRPPIGLGKQ